MSTVTLYSRQHCHLCVEAERVLRRLVAPPDVLEIVDIDTDAALTDRYTVRVPVVAVDGTEIAQYQVEESAVRAILAARRLGIQSEG